MKFEKDCNPNASDTINFFNSKSKLFLYSNVSGPDPVFWNATIPFSNPIWRMLLTASPSIDKRVSCVAELLVVFPIAASGGVLVFTVVSDPVFVPVVVGDVVIGLLLLAELNAKNVAAKPAIVVPNSAMSVIFYCWWKYKDGFL